MIKISTLEVSKSISDLEIETITNYLIRESIEIINEELEFFFLTREKLLGPVLDGAPLGDLDFRVVQSRLNNILYTKEEVKILVEKIEKRINKEIRMAQLTYNFRFNLRQISWEQPGTRSYDKTVKKS